VRRISDPIGDATAHGIRADVKFRGIMVGVMCLLFLGLNGAVMLVLYLAFQADMTLLQRTPPLPAADRLVTADVLTALIGATVVQTGIASSASFPIFSRDGQSDALACRRPEEPAPSLLEMTNAPPAGPCTAGRRVSCRSQLSLQEPQMQMQPRSVGPNDIPLDSPSSAAELTGTASAAR
jgi:hypothetical protein